VAFKLAKNKHKTLIGLFIVFVIALTFRFYQLSSHPVSLSMDEVSIGYNAYSILKTGKDEWGVRMPLAFKSVGDYKPPVNIYLTVPSIAIFGLNEFAVRAPVALIGSLTAVIFALLLKELGFSRLGYLFGGFWLAVLPWHVHFSRASFEAVTAFFFLVLGTWLFVSWTKKRRTSTLVMSAIAFSLSVWSYHAERLFVPIIVVFLLILFKDRIDLRKIKIRKQMLIFAAVVAIFAVPFLNLTFSSPAISERAVSTSILREASLISALHWDGYSNFGEMLFDNNYYLIFRHWLGKYLNYFDLRFWFWRGGGYTPPGHIGMGLFYLVDLPLLLIGFYSLAFHKNKRIRNLATFWFFAGPLPAAFTMNEQHTLRALVWIPFFGLAVASGIEWFRNNVVRKRKLLTRLYIIFLLVNIIYFSDMYFRQFPRFFSEYWQYGFKEIALFACENRENYESIVISETFGSEGPLNTGIPYIYVLFYCRYDPGLFLANNRQQVYNFVFRRVNWVNDPIEFKNSLLIGSPWDFQLDEVPESQIIKRIDFLNGKPGFLFVEI